MLFPTARSYK